MACCGSLDIVPTSKLNNDSLSIWDYEIDFSRIQSQLMDRPLISIKTKEKPTSDIYAWHADAACETELQVINDKLWQMGVPPKCFYWSNITYIQFFTTDDKMPQHDETDLEEFLGIENILELNSIAFRLFDDERFVIIYDEKTKEVSLEYEKGK